MIVNELSFLKRYHLLVATKMVILQEYCIFWPMGHDDLECESFRVRFTAESQAGSYVLRDFTLQSRTVGNC